MSERPQPKLPGQRRSRAKESNAATWIALFGMLVLGGLLMGLTAMVMPNVLGIVGLVFGAAIFGMIHYVTWGRWLSNRRQSARDEYTDEP